MGKISENQADEERPEERSFTRLKAWVGYKSGVKGAYMKSGGMLGTLLVAVLVLSSMFMLAGCSRLTETATKKAVEKSTGVSVDEEEGKVKVRTKEGEAELEAGENKLPDGFPDDFPIYKGAKVASSTKMTLDQGTSYTVQLEAKESVSTVADYYKEALPDAAYKIEGTMETDGNVMYTLEGGGIVQVMDQQGKTKIQITLMEK